MLVKDPTEICWVIENMFYDVITEGELELPIVKENKCDSKPITLAW